MKTNLFTGTSRVFDSSFSGHVPLIQYNGWYSNLDEGKYTGIVLADLKTAFDAVDYEILITKLSQYGIRNTELRWYCSYLNIDDNAVWLMVNHLILNIYGAVSPRGRVMDLFWFFSAYMICHTHLHAH